MHTLFVYGTLLIDEVMNRVTGKTFPTFHAVLNNYARFRLKNAPYPGIIFKKDSYVDGRLLLNIDDASLHKIDLFEGDIYERIEVNISADNGEHHRSYAYMVRKKHAHLLTKEPWDEGEFLKNEIKGFLDDIEQ